MIAVVATKSGTSSPAASAHDTGAAIDAGAASAERVDAAVQPQSPPTDAATLDATTSIDAGSNRSHRKPRGPDDID